MAHQASNIGSKKFKRKDTSSAKRKQFNAAGYAKRQSRKTANAAAKLNDDVYEYTAEQPRRSKIELDLDHDEEAGFGRNVGDDDDDDMEDFRMKAKLLGEGDRVDTDDDEEIDSDAAFEEDDEDRFAGFFSSKNKSKKTKKNKKSAVRFAEVDLNEDEDMQEQESPSSYASDSDEEDEEASGVDDEFFDILDILDGRADPTNDDDDQATHPPQSGPSKPNVRAARGSEDAQDREDENGEDDEQEEDEDEEDEDENVSITLSDAEEEAVGALEELQNFVTSLDPTSKKRRAEDEERPASLQPKKRRLLKEETEAGEESEFRTKSAGLTLTDLLAPLAGNTSAAFDKSVKALQHTGPASKKRAQTLSAPLPQRAQERLDREAAYEQTKAEVQKWSATMKRIQEAEHLSFPLQPKETQGRASNLELAAKFKPTTAFESTVSKLLASANLSTDASVLQTEENMLKANALSVEEVNERRKELRKMRELMFRAETKAKRVKKIKSKVYRRIKRKEREKGDDLDMDVDEEEARLKHETERARERATLRHKNTGKWAKSTARKNGYDDEDGDVRSGRQEIEEMLSRGEKLRRKIAGVGSDDEDGSGSDSDGDDEDAINGAFNELKALRDEQPQQQEAGKKKGSMIFDMKFMKDAEARKQQEANAMVDDFMREMGQTTGEEGDGDIQDIDGGVLVSRTGGRMVFRPGASATGTFIGRTVEKAPSEGSSTLKSTVDTSSSPPSPLLPTKTTQRSLLSQQDTGATSQSAEAVNPWLVVGADSSTMTKSKNKLKKQAKKLEADKAKAREDAVVEIETDAVLAVSSAKGKGKANRKEKKSQVVDEDDSDANSEIDAQEAALLQKSKKGKAKATAFEQRDLVARAFAGDNVVQAFEEAKRREIAMDAPTEVDTTLPGWGSWGGTGVQKGPPKPHLIKKVAGIDPKSRADYKKGHVIISEKRDKKAAKYMVNDLPYPYTSKAQYERRMEQPLGPEWNTRVGFQKGTLPKVVKKMGTVIDPLEKLF